MWFDNFAFRRSTYIPEYSGALARHTHIQAQRLASHQSSGRHIHVLPYSGMDAKWGVEKLDTSPVSRKYLITGTGRCGTTYLAKVLKYINVDVPHGKVGQDGTTSHYFMVDSNWYPVITYNPDDVAHIGERASDYTFERIIYMVREPLSAIRSLAIFFGKIDELFYEESGIVPKGTFERHSNLIWRGMVLYYYVNIYIRDTYPNHLLVQMENLRSLRQWDVLLDYMGMEYVTMPNIPAQNKMGGLTFDETERLMRRYYGEEQFMHGYNAFPQDVTYSYLESLDRQMAENVACIASYIGYPRERS